MIMRHRRIRTARILNIIARIAGGESILQSSSSNRSIV